MEEENKNNKIKIIKYIITGIITFITYDFMLHFVFFACMGGLPDSCQPNPILKTPILVPIYGIIKIYNNSKTSLTDMVTMIFGLIFYTIEIIFIIKIIKEISKIYKQNRIKKVEK